MLALIIGVCKALIVLTIKHCRKTKIKIVTETVRQPYKTCEAYKVEEVFN